MADSRVHVYHNLSVMLAAGVPITRSLRSVQAGGAFGRQVSLIAEDVARGQSLTDTVKARSRTFSSLEQTLIEVGEQTGQLAEILESLSQWFAFRRDILRTMRSGMLLPLLYIHATALIVPLIACALNEFDPVIYVRGLVGILAVFYTPAIAILAVIFLTPKSGPLRYALDAVVLKIPLLGAGVRELELSRFCKVFAMADKAGIPIVQSARMAVSIVRSQIIAGRLKGGAEAVQAGREMSTGFSRSLPGEFFGLWQTGEETGDLDNAAARLGRMHADNARMKFEALARWLPRLIYAGVCMVMAYFILTGYMRLFGQAFSY